MARTARAGRYVLRSASTVIPFWIGVVVLAGVIAIPLLQADWHLLRFVLGPCLLLAWVLWFALYRPAVHYDAQRAVVVNFGRIHVLPWSHVTAVRQGISLVFELDAGKRISAFGVPAPRRTGNVAGNFDRRTRPVESFHHEAELLDGVRQAAAPVSEPVTRSWDVVPLAIGGVLVLAVIVEFALQV
ncbi:MAG TPA: hypothetical protein VN759_12825 [Pseudolysinimonas sp.]|nr:hypothetical protein [Pseudolysinimonas sp.]